MTKPWTAFIPIRGGSKGLPGKNTRPLLGKPLYMHTVDHATQAGAKSIYISTDIDKVLTADHPNHVQTIARANHLAADTSSMDMVLSDFLKSTPIQGPVVLLQATSPLRRPSDISAALDLFSTGPFDLVKTVTQTSSSILKYGQHDQGRFIPVSKPDYCFSNRQSLPKIYRPNGAVYVFDADWYRANGSLSTDSIGMVEMPEIASHDIDTQADFDAIADILKSS